ncbi:hypothetical protein BDW71DRAFT_83051 [Aspergillus fruticulosus]
MFAFVGSGHEIPASAASFFVITSIFVPVALFVLSASKALSELAPLLSICSGLCPCCFHDGSLSGHGSKRRSHNQEVLPTQRVRGPGETPPQCASYACWIGTSVICNSLQVSALRSSSASSYQPDDGFSSRLGAVWGFIRLYLAFLQVSSLSRQLSNDLICGLLHYFG